MLRESMRMRTQIRAEHVAFSPITTDEYESAICCASPRKKSAFGVPET